MMTNQFKYFLLNEQKVYLGQKAGDILTALQNLAEDAPNMGHRALIRTTQSLANQIRRILHGRWDDSDVKYLKTFQKIGVALLRGIDDKDDLTEVISSCGVELQKLLDDLEVPQNSVASEEEAPEEDETELETGNEIGA